MAAATDLNALSSASRIPTGTPWIVARNFDLGFFLLSGLVVLLPLAATRIWNVNPYTILVFVAVLANGPHLSATWSRVYLDTNELRRRPFAYIGVPILFGIFVYVVTARFDMGLRFLNSMILYWATYHFAAQCYGLLRIYQRKGGEGTRAIHRIEAFFVFAVAVSGLMYRIRSGPPVLFGTMIYVPPIEGWMVAVAIASVLAAIVVILNDQIRRGLDGQRVAWTRLAFLCAVSMGFYVPFILIKDGTAAFAAAAAWHAIQYLGIVYHYNRTKFSNPDAARGAPVIAWASRNGRVWAYVPLMLALVGGMYGGAFLYAKWMHTGFYTISLVVWSTLTMSHYWIDGLIWKLRHAPNSRVLVSSKA